MPKFAANLSMLYADSPVLERFARASDSGFRFVEYQFPYERDAGEFAAALERHGLGLALFNLPAGNWTAGERGIACMPDRVEEFRAGVGQAVAVAKTLQCRRLNCLVGKRDACHAVETQRKTMVENLRFAGEALAREGMTLMVEALNHFDFPGFFLTCSQAAFEVLDEVGLPNVQFQYDVYHLQRVEGELAGTIQRNLSRIGHIQIADNPGRHQPGTGEINYRFLLAFLDRIGYQGYVALEYNPEGKTEDTLGWIREYGFRL